MIKILQFIHSYVFGGAEEHVLALTRELCTIGFQTDIACTNKKVYEQLNAKRGKGIHFSIYLFEIPRKISVKAILTISLFIKGGSYDIVHVHQVGYGGTVGRIAARLAIWPKIVITEHTIASEHYWLKGSVSKFLHLNIFHPLWNTFFVDRVIATSRAVQESIITREKISPRKTTVVFNGIDLKRYATPDKSAKKIMSDYGVREGACILGFIGRLSTEKGIEYLIKAVSILKKEKKNIILLITGDGPQKEKLQRLIEQLGLQGSILFTGWIQNISSILSILDIFVLSSLNEAFGLVVLEAMAAKVPVIGTTVGGIPDIIEDRQNGLLVPPKDSPAIAQAVKLLLSDKIMKENIAHNGFITVKTKFTSHIMAINTGNIYKNCIPQKRTKE